jgi:prepilin-type N-terminal cleavage/methylation domain-containing protein/prepilin-type processing-associated H-X9-DG protein
MRKSHIHPPVDSGFTLIELLVVVTVIGVLLAILLSVFAQSRRKARQAQCQSNERQIAQAFQMYLSDNDSFWPIEFTWRRGVKPYLGLHTGLLACPDVAPAPRLVVVEGIAGYAYNTALMGAWNPNGSAPPIHEAVVLYPSTTVSVCDEALGVPVTNGPDPYKYDPQSRPPDEEEGWKRHSGGANYLFCDGHAKWYMPDVVGYNTDLRGGNNGTAPSFALGPRP